MSVTSDAARSSKRHRRLRQPGACSGSLVAVVGRGGVLLLRASRRSLAAWQQPEYSHGPLIPVLSGLLFLRQLKDVPIQRDGPRRPLAGRRA